MDLTNKTPGQLADFNISLASEYSTLSDELGRILSLKDVNWSILRATVTSDKQADRKWHQTKQGLREREIELRMKSIQRTMSAIKTFLHVKSEESRNQY